MSASKEQWVSDQTLLKIQAGSGLAFGSFLSLHLLNAASAHFGYLAYDGVQEILRLYYQNPVVELGAVAGSLIVHVTASATRYWRRWKRGSPSVLKDEPVDSDSSVESKGVSFNSWKAFYESMTPLRLHRWTGYYLTGVVLVHVSATRLPTLLLDIPADFSSVSFSIYEWPIIFYPYYFLLGTCGVYHLTYGAIQALSYLGVKTPNFLSPRRKPFWGIVGVSSLALLSSVLAFGGLYFPVPTERYADLRHVNERLFTSVVSFVLHRVLPTFGPAIVKSAVTPSK